VLDPPIFINCRDRVTDLRRLVDFLEQAGHARITLLDNTSTYPPLLDYLAASPHTVVRLPNLGSRSLWRAGLVPSEQFVFTDPDLVPIDECPHDLVDVLREALAASPYTKAGVGLYLDDTPADMPSRGWEEGPEINGPMLTARSRHSLVDTTFALYEPDTHFELQSTRTIYPYLMRHLSWYVQEGYENAEDRYYLEHAEGHQLASSWAIEYHAKRLPDSS
jgi:hypothetical protein